MVLKQFKEDWLNYLKRNTALLVVDLQRMLQSPVFKYNKGASLNNVAAIFFEYEYDYFDIACWPVDKKGGPIAAPLFYPSDKSGAKQTKKSKWNSFYPEKLWADFERFIEANEDNEDDIRDNYDEMRSTVFEKWFIRCWQKAAKGKKSFPAFLSIHDSSFKTDLNTGKECNQKDIDKLLKTKK